VGRAGEKAPGIRRRQRRLEIRPIRNENDLLACRILADRPRTVCKIKAPRNHTNQVNRSAGADIGCRSPLPTIGDTQLAGENRLIFTRRLTPPTAPPLPPKNPAAP
jgi:hypothetical protein